MASENAYQYSKVDMQFVVDNIDEYIIPENQEACKLLWSKNIFTIMCNNYENEESWITIGGLDESNQKLFDEMALKDSRFGNTWGGRGIKVPIVPVPGADAFSAFKPLIEMFAMQDVQKEGYMTKEEFLTYRCDCFKMIPNPDYIEIQQPVMGEDEEPLEFMKRWDEYMYHTMIPREVRTFDESKMTKTFDEYLQESEFADFYDEDNERIYYNDFYYQAHVKYKEKNKVPSV